MKKFKYRVLTRFLLLSSIIIIIIIPVSLFYFKKKEDYCNISREIDKTYILLLQNINNQALFFNQEKTNPEFFTSGNSKYLTFSARLNLNIESKLDSVNRALDHSSINDLISRIQHEFREYNGLFNEISQLFLKRGYKDWGIEGEMRSYVHLLENYPQVDQRKVLTLRRHEKDYIIRNDENYITNLKKVSSELKNEITSNSCISPLQKDSIIRILDNYMLYFNQLVSLDKKTGLKDQTGLKNILDHKALTLEILFQSLISRVNTYTENAYQNLKIYYLISSSIIFVISIILSFMISNPITMPVTRLSKSITRFVDSEFKIKQELKQGKETNDEINLLTENFMILQNEIQSYIRDLNNKVTERTEKITIQKNKIEVQKKKIELQAQEVSRKNAVIEKQKQTLEIQNKRMKSSISYAKHIQNAILPEASFMDDILPDHFIIYSPRDIVSGDFYWIDQIITRNRELIMFAVADCTGHGVPGALMSIIGHNAINHAVKEEEKINPAHILSSVNKYIYQSLHKNISGNTISDGLDIAFCVYDRKCMSLEYSGTYRPLIIIRENEMIEIKGEKIPLGTALNDSMKMKRHKIKLKKGDTIYLFSDGYADQFGGPSGKKLKYKNLKNILLEIQSFSMNRQQKILSDHLKEWMSAKNNVKSSYEQVDDILIMGIKI